MDALTSNEFKEKVFDYDQSDSWAFKGSRPAIIDFYADWCGPCKRLAPILEEISKQYEGKLDVYKINIDTEPDVANTFGIMSVPSLLFAPMAGEPQMAQGALPKEILEQAIQDVFSIK